MQEPIFSDCEDVPGDTICVIQINSNIRELDINMTFIDIKAPCW